MGASRPFSFPMNEVQTMPRHLMTPKQVAERAARDNLRASPSTLAKWRVSGGGPPFVRLAGRVFYVAAEVETWLAHLIDGLPMHASTASYSTPGKHKGRPPKAMR
jgi:hypothetical protein